LPRLPRRSYLVGRCAGHTGVRRHGHLARRHGADGRVQKVLQPVTPMRIRDGVRQEVQHRRRRGEARCHAAAATHEGARRRTQAQTHVGEDTRGDAHEKVAADKARAKAAEKRATKQLGARVSAAYQVQIKRARNRQAMCAVIGFSALRKVHGAPGGAARQARHKACELLTLVDGWVSGRQHLSTSRSCAESWRFLDFSTCAVDAPPDSGDDAEATGTGSEQLPSRAASTQALRFRRASTRSSWRRATGDGAGTAAVGCRDAMVGFSVFCCLNCLPCVYVFSAV